MLIDAAKGVEPQTKKLFAICRARRIPLFTFINKMDRPSRDPLELLDELENVLGHRRVPDELAARQRRDVPRRVRPRARARCTSSSARSTARSARRCGVDRRAIPQIAALVDERTYREFLDQLELLEGAGAGFDREAMLRGDVTPVFFGSAVTNFGVELFLDAFVRMGPPPAPRVDAEKHRVEPTDERSPASCSRSRPTWIRAIATASRSCACAPASSSAT